MIRYSLKLKLTVLFSLILVTISLVTGLSFYTQTKEVLLSSFIKNGLLLSKNLAHHSRYGVFTEDSTTLMNLIQGLLQVEEVVFVVIRNQDGNTLAYETKSDHFFKDEFYQALPETNDLRSEDPRMDILQSNQGEKLYHFLAKVTFPLEDKSDFPMELLEEKTLQTMDHLINMDQGSISIGMSPHLLDKQMDEILFNSALMTLAMMVGGICLIYYLSKFAIQPLERLASFTQRVAAGDLLQTVPVTSYDEIGKLTTTFNQMILSLRKRDHQIRSHTEQLETLNRKLQELNQTLDERVRIRTSQLEAVIRQVRNEQQKTESIIHDIADGVIVTNEKHQIIMLNPAAHRILIGKSQEIPEPNITQAINLPVLIDLLENPEQNVSREIEVHDDALSIPKTFMTRVDPLKDAEGRFLGSIVVFHDITSLKQIDRLKSDFVSQVSHDLRTPLTSIKGYIDNLEDGIAGRLSGRQKEYLERMSRNVNRLARLIEDLLDISQIEAGTMQLNMSQFPLQDLILEVMTSLRPITEQRHLEVALKVLDGKIQIRGDWNRLEQVVTNLLDNAAKFTPPGGKITITLERDNGYVKTSIRDNGIGIPNAHLSKIFDRFYRSPHTADSEEKGTGLGLFIVSSVINMHQGKVWAESDLGKGSRFIFTLPADPH